MSRLHRLFSRTFECRIVLLLLLAIASPIRAQTSSFQVIVHAANPATEISARTVSGIFLGKITRWPAGTAITPYDLPPDSAVRAEFSRQILGQSTSSILGYWQRLTFGGRGVPPEQMSPGEVLDAVRATPGAIAYVDAGTALPSGVKRLSITRGDDRARGRGENDETAPAVPDGALLALAVSPASSETVWASFQGRGLWISTDGGTTWGPAPESPEPTLSALAFDRVDSQLLLAGGENGLYRSLDGGQQWQRIPAGDRSLRLSGIRGIVTLPQSPGTFFVAAGDALLRSDDSGATFTLLAVPGRVRTFNADPITGDLWLATDRSILFSRDRGDNWSRSVGLSGSSIRQILVAHLAGTRTLWVAVERVLLRAELDEDGRPAEGIADSSSRKGGSLRPSLQRAVQHLYALDDTIYAATGQGIYELAGDGQTWQQISPIRNAVLAADPYGSGRVFAGNAQGRIWRRDHSGDVWRQVFDYWNPDPLPAAIGTVTDEDPSPERSPAIPLRLRCAPERGHVGALAVHPSSRGVLWAGSEHGVFRSDDGGRSWGPPGRGLAITDVHSLAVDPKTPTTIWAGTHGGGVYVSRDSGASWTAASDGTPGLYGAAVHEVRVDPSVPALVYATTPGGVFVSRDRGAQWHTLTALSERGNLLSERDPAWRIAPRALAINPAQHRAMALVDERGRLFDVDAVPATRQTRPDRVRPPRSHFSGQVCADGGRGISGSPAHPRPERTVRDLIFGEDPEGSTVPWAATAFGVWRGAQDWDAAWTRLPLATNVAAVAIDPRDPRRVYAAAVDGLWRSGDAGATWRRWGLDEAVFSLALDPGLSEQVYAGLADGRIAVVREPPSGDQPEVESIEVPSRRSGPVARSRLRGISSVLPQPVSPAPDDPGSAFYRVAVSTPHTASRVRALYAAEGLARGLSGDRRDYLRNLLIATLERIRGDALAHGRELPATVAASPGGRWLFSEWRFDDGLRSHSELRMYAPEAQGWERPPSAQTEPSTAWQKLHDLTLEPRHLRPAWLFEDPGPRLAWSDSRRLLATHGGPDRILIWNLPDQVPEEMGRVLAPRIVALERGQNPRGARSALSDSGVWMAVARNYGDRDRKTRAAVLRLWRLGSQAEQRTLDVVTRSTSEPSPYFTHLLFTGDERHVVGLRADGSGQLWRVGLTGDVETEALPGDRFKTATRGPGGNWMATLTGDEHSSELQLWRLRGPGSFLPVSLASGSVISQVSFHDDESWLSAVIDGRTARLWDLLERPDRRARRQSPEEPPEVQLAATTPAACAALFDPRGDWLTHERGASKLWQLHTPGAGGHPVRSRRPSWRPVADGETCSRLPASAQRVGALALERGRSREVLSLWDLSRPEPRHLSAQMQRFGPSDLHLDEGDLRAPDPILGLWPERPLKALSDGALRALTCKLVGRPLSPEEWSFAMGDADYRPLCPPLPER